MQNIEIMFSDGLIGNKAVLLALSTLTTGNLNSKLKQGSTPFTINHVLPSAHDYIVPPLSDEQKAAENSKKLMSFLALAPNVPSIITEAIK